MPVNTNLDTKVELDKQFSTIKTNDQTSFWFDTEDIDPETANSGNDSSYKTAMGNTISSWTDQAIDLAAEANYDSTEKRDNLVAQSIDYLSYSMGGSNNAQVLGMPLSFSPLDDPAGEVYAETFEQDLPIVFFHPGKPRVNRRLFGTKEEGGLFNLGTTGNRLASMVVEESTVGKAFSMLGMGSYRDARFISFKSDWATYHTYVQTILQYIHASMGLRGVFLLSQQFKNPSVYGIPFYASKGTSISESSNNEYRQSELAAEANSKAMAIREKKMMASTGQAGILAQIGDFLAETLRNMTQDIPVIGGLVSALTENLDGSVLQYPDVWANSTFDRSYSLEFRFYSPYGDPESIMKYVYTPFISLIAMGLPLQDSYYSYKQPFLVRLSSPGKFECECGVIRSINIERGTEQTWTAENLPREIIVRMNIADLYSSLMLSRTSAVMKYNTGLLSYIECMAGIRYDQLNLIKRAGTMLKVRGSQRLENILTLNGLINTQGDKAYNFSQNILTFLR